MPFKPGQPRPPNAGRKKGGLTRESVKVICAKAKCDPIAVMCGFVADVNLKAEFRGRMAAELAQYLHPKLRAVEHTGPGGGPVEILNESARDEFARRITGLAARIGTPTGDSGTE